MVTIMSDTSTLYTIEQGRQKGIVIVPLGVAIDAHCYREFEEIDAETFQSFIDKGFLPTSSQPAIGEVIDAYNSAEGDIVNITMAHGLSGTYESACMARGQAEHTERINVVNSKTLCGPQRHIVDAANDKAQAGASLEEVLTLVSEMVATSISFLIPDDFDYLHRGGRLSPLAAKMMGALKVIPVLVQSNEGQKLDAHRVHRRPKLLCADMAKSLQKHGVGQGWIVSVGHANNRSRAQMISDAVAQAIPQAIVEILELSPAFITQGGPECVSVQAVKTF